MDTALRPLRHVNLNLMKVVQEGSGLRGAENLHVNTRKKKPLEPKVAGVRNTYSRVIINGEVELLKISHQTTRKIEMVKKANRAQGKRERTQLHRPSTWRYGGKNWAWTDRHEKLQVGRLARLSMEGRKRNVGKRGAHRVPLKEKEGDSATEGRRAETVRL